ncbi:hypothetical protein GCM10010357_09450 [Streptomyces luteireticuli]|uniref:Uncharacterized protein n=1 Tax=Streptomyces luteireticuli TaxID=173858 RepID=A0ABN0YCH3_9ACTN
MAHDGTCLSRERGEKRGVRDRTHPRKAVEEGARSTRDRPGGRGARKRRARNCAGESGERGKRRSLATVDVGDGVRGHTDQRQLEAGVLVGVVVARHAEQPERIFGR